MSDEQNNVNTNPAEQTVEENTTKEETPKKKKNGCLICCGCIIGAFVLGVIIIALISLFTVLGVKSAVKPDLDNFFEYYNKNDVGYICTNLIPNTVVKSECEETLTNMNDSLGKELNYRLSILSGTNIKISSKNGETTKYIKTTGNFEKQKDVNLEFTIFVDKSGKSEINSFRFKMNH